MFDEWWLMMIKQMKYQFLLQAKSYEKLWAEKARRELLKKIMDEWVAAKKNKEPTVENLLSALNAPGFMDVKFRVEKLLKQNYA